MRNVGPHGSACSVKSAEKRFERSYAPRWRRDTGIAGRPSGSAVELGAVSTAPKLSGGTIGGNDFVVGEWFDDGETTSVERPIAPLHEGTLGFRHGAKLVEPKAGAAVLVPAGTAHSFWNARPAPARYLIVMTPRIAALVAAVHEPGARDDLEGLFHRFDSRLVH
jgi:hypothetical protein